MTQVPDGEELGGEGGAGGEKAQTAAFAEHVHGPIGPHVLVRADGLQRGPPGSQRSHQKVAGHGPALSARVQLEPLGQRRPGTHLRHDVVARLPLLLGKGGMDRWTGGKIGDPGDRTVEDAGHGFSFRPVEADSAACDPGR